ncbi:MAG TPA: HD domain-containing protein [Thermomicrobiales bacterium]|nr:HD domain-containing protein [Thermomicrobiales bacterium]
MDERTERQERGRLAPAIDAPIATTIRDALYDRIPLSEPELALMDTAPFRRLERIQQLGFVSRIWPGARHVRADHSLGVLHLTRLAVEHLRSLPDGRWIRTEDARVIVAAALLHDIGHYPFSHAVEELGPPIAPHEAVGRRIVEGPEIAPILRDRWGIDPARVAAVIDPAGRSLPEPDRILRGLLSGPLDMDKLDYLPRDAHACNVPYGGVDTARLIDALRIETAPAGDGAARRVVISDKGVSALHSLINARQEMFDNVYWHHANRACMAMLLRAVQEALLARALRPEQLWTFDDRSLVAALAAADMPEPTRRLVRALDERRIHKRGVEFSARAVELYGRLGNLYFDPYARRTVEDRLAAGLGELTGEAVPPGSILIDIPKPERWRTDLWVRFDEPPVGFSELMSWREVVGLADADFKQYEEHRRLIRIVAAAPVRDALRQHWERLLLPLLGGVV